MLLEQYLPPYLTQTKTFTSILNTEQIEINGVENTIQDIINQCFVDTATWGLSNWESFLGIVTDQSKDINYRRTVIKSKLRGQGTVTVNMIQNVANSFNNGQVTVLEHPSAYSFEIQFTETIGVPPNLSDLQNAINTIKPAHLEVTYTYLYTQWSKVKTTTWATVKTGAWGGLLNGKVI